MSAGGATSDAIAGPLAALGHDVSVVSRTAAAARDAASYELVVINGSGADVADVLRRLRSVAAAAGTPIMAVAESLDVEQRIALIEAGADDVLGQPFDSRQLELLAEALLSRSRPVVHESAPAERAAQEGPGRVICFASAKGGAGTTTLAVNTAVSLARKAPGVAIADLDFHHGQVAAHLDLTPRHTTADLAASEADALDHALTDVALDHDSGVRVYAAPLRPDQASSVGADDMIELVRALRARHRLVVIDAGSVPGTRALALLGMADESVIVVAPDIPGLRALNGMLAVMQDNGTIGEQNHFVVNSTFAAQQIARADIEQHLSVSVAMEIPFDGESCVRAVNEGQPVLLLNPRSPVASAIEKLATLVSVGEAAEAAEPVRRGRLGGLLGRR